MLRFDRKQQNSVKQLSFNKKVLKNVYKVVSSFCLKVVLQVIFHVVQSAVISLLM